MKKTKHPIQLPDSLINKWLEDTDISLSVQFQEAAKWGADAELEACCQWLNFTASVALSKNLNKVRRPSANANALAVLDRISADIGVREAAILRNALENEGVDG